MSERYSRLFSLPTNLYTEGSPVLIAAGALLKDNHTNKVLAQLKFRNISLKAIKSVKVKINAYDTAKGQLAGIDAFSYLDLSVAANEEFGQRTPIHLPDTTTRSFSVEILSVVYADNEVFTPHTVSVAEAAPKDVLEGVQRVEAEKQAAREAIKAERVKQEMILNKQRRRIMVCGFVSLASVLLSIVLLSTISSMSFGQVIRHFSVRFILALIVPCLCLLAAFVGKKNSTIIKPALIICVVLFALQIVSIIIYNAVFYGRLPKGLFPLIRQIDFFRYVNGVEFGAYLGRTMRMLGRVPGRVIGQDLALIAPGFFAVLPNILCTTVLAIYSKKMK